MRYELSVARCAEEYKVDNVLSFQKENINSHTARKCFKSIGIF